MVLVISCKSGPPVQTDSKRSTDSPSVMVGLSQEKMLEYLLGHISRYGVSPELQPSYFFSKGAVLPTYDASSNSFIFPSAKAVAFERWLEELGFSDKVAYDERIVSFILNYALLVEFGSFLRLFYKIYDAAHPEIEEKIAQDFASGVIESLSQTEVMVRQERDSTAFFLSKILPKGSAEFVRLDQEGLIKWVANNRDAFRSGTPRFAAVRLVFIKEHLAKMTEPMKTDQWFKQYVMDAYGKARKGIVLYDPSLRVVTVRAGQSPTLTPLLGLFPRLSCVQFDPEGRLLISDFKNISMLKKGESLQLVSGEQAAFSPTVFTFFKGSLLFVDGETIRFIDLAQKDVKNVDISAQFKHPGAQYNFGIVPIAADGSRIYIADNIQRRILVVDENGSTLDSFGVDGLVGGIACSEGKLYITLTNRHVVESYDERMKTFVTVAGVRDFEGHLDGKGINALFNEPLGLSPLSDGSLVVADSKNNAIRRVTADGDVATISGFSVGKRDGKVEEASFFLPFSVATGMDDQIVVGELGTGRVALITKGAPRLNEQVYPPIEVVVPFDDVEVRRHTEAIRNAPLGYRLYLAYCERGLRLAQLKQFDAALADTKKAATIIPFSMRAYVADGDIYLMQGNVDEAINAYTKALYVKERLSVAERCSDPFYIKTYYLRALTHLKKDDTDSALKDVEQALSYRSHIVSVLRYPDVPIELLTDMLTLKGNILLKKGKFEDAERVLSDAIRRMRGLKEAHLYRGIARMSLKDYSGASNDLKQAVILDVRWAEPLYWLGRLYEEGFEDPKRALEYYSTHLVLGGSHKADAEQRVERLSKVVGSRLASGSYTEEIIEDSDGKKWIVRRYTDGKTEKLPYEEK